MAKIEQNLKQLFRKNSDCKSIYEAGNMITEIPAMAEEKFIEIVSNLLTKRNCAIQSVVKSSWVEMDEDIKFILGRPNYFCGKIARRLRELGHECERNVEDEQALVIHTMLTYYYKYGKNWKDEFNKYLKDG